MTQDKNQGSEDLSWMEIADTDAITQPRRTGQRLPFIAAAVSLLIIAGGVLFAQANSESPAQAEDISATQSPAASTLSPSALPVVPNVAPSDGKYGDDKGEGEDHYGRHGDDEEDDD
jgi:hypothetical protein